MQYESVTRDNMREGAKLAFGEYVNTVYRVDQADVIVTLDSDFLTSGPGCIRYARDFARKRRVEGPESKMNRLYAVESTPTNTGAMADHRLRMKASDIEGFARALARELGVSAVAGPAARSECSGWLDSRPGSRPEAASRRISGGCGRSAAAHRACARACHQSSAWAISTRLSISRSPSKSHRQTNGIPSVDLAADIRAGSVTTLLILGSNPAYDAPADLGFKEILPKVPFSARLGLYEDETSALCHWHIPQAHELESWGDARGFDGTASVIQPLIAPLYGGKSEVDFLAVLNGQAVETESRYRARLLAGAAPQCGPIRRVLGKDAARRSCRRTRHSRQSKFR